MLDDDYNQNFAVIGDQVTSSDTYDSSVIDLKKLVSQKFCNILVRAS